MDCKNCNFKSVAFQKLTEEQLFKVDEHRVELSFKKGELLSKQGMLLSQIIYIRKGFAKLYVEQDGELVILGIAQPGTFVGIQALYGEVVFHIISYIYVMISGVIALQQLNIRVTQLRPDLDQVGEES